METGPILLKHAPACTTSTLHSRSWGWTGYTNMDFSRWTRRDGGNVMHNLPNCASRAATGTC